GRRRARGVRRSGVRRASRPAAHDHPAGRATAGGGGRPRPVRAPVGAGLRPAAGAPADGARGPGLDRRSWGVVTMREASSREDRPDEGPGFLWGAATSACRVGGGSREDVRGESIWYTFCRKPGAIRGGDTGDVA